MLILVLSPTDIHLNLLTSSNAMQLPAMVQAEMSSDLTHTATGYHAICPLHALQSCDVLLLTRILLNQEELCTALTTDVCLSTAARGRGGGGVTKVALARSLSATARPRPMKSCISCFLRVSPACKDNAQVSIPLPPNGAKVYMTYKCVPDLSAHKMD